MSPGPPLGVIHCDRCGEVIGVCEPMVAVSTQGRANA